MEVHHSESLTSTTKNPYNTSSDTDDSDFLDKKELGRMGDDRQLDKQWILLAEKNTMNAVRAQVLDRKSRHKARNTIRKLSPSLQIREGGLGNIPAVREINESISAGHYDPERLGEMYAIC